MKRHAEEAKIIAEAFELLLYACEEIKERDQCDNCPMHSWCIEDTNEPPIEFSNVSASLWQEFLEYAEDAPRSEAAAKADYYDWLRDFRRDNEREDY